MSNNLRQVNYKSSVKNNAFKLTHSLLYPTIYLASMSVSYATIVQHNGSSIDASFNDPLDPTVTWDIDGDGLVDFNLDSCAGPDIFRLQVMNAGTVNGLLVGTSGRFGNSVVPVMASTLIGQAGLFGNAECGLIGHSCNDSRLGDWELFGAGADPQRDRNVINGFFGFSFLAGSGSVNYGVASFTGRAVPVDTNPGESFFSITGWAYDDSGADLHASQAVLDGLGAQVPEPDSLSLGLVGLAAGATGLRRRRRVHSQNQSA